MGTVSYIMMPGSKGLNPHEFVYSKINIFLEHTILVIQINGRWKFVTKSIFDAAVSCCVIQAVYHILQIAAVLAGRNLTKRHTAFVRRCLRHVNRTDNTVGSEYIQ